MSKEGFVVDEKAGGGNVCGGFASFQPGPDDMKKEAKTGKMMNRPYIRGPTVVDETGDISTIFGEVLGEIACAIAELLPDIYAENHSTALSDCTFPTPEMQSAHKVMGEGSKIPWWYCNQTIVRVFSMDLCAMPKSDMRISLHSDRRVPNLLFYLHANIMHKTVTY